jgi:eukaryotic-like serine/threonine-protein kinase
MAELSPSEAFRPGDRLGPYTLLCPLATGGMGTVWSAAFAGARGFSKFVAIKAILHEFADEVEYARALRDEAQLAATLSHPNLCDVTELAESQGFPFLVMEWVDGASLAELLGAGSNLRAPTPLEPELAAQIAADTCAGLHALHEARDHAGVALGAVHRDVSPHNILLTRVGQVKVSDLGVAKARGQWRARTRSGELRGKPGYLAPEQLRGGTADRRTDVHAVGCVLYLCLTGSLPYAPEISAFESLLSGTYQPLHTLSPDVPEPLAAIVARALKSEPAERFQTAHEMRVALEGFCAGGVAEQRSERIAACLRERIGPLIEERNSRILRAFAELLGGQEGRQTPVSAR